jgi:hypothetical protein
MHSRSFLILVFAPTALFAQNPGEYRIVAADADKELVADLKRHLDDGKKKVERFFGSPFKSSFVVEICPNRAALDDYFTKRWKMPKTQAWMVAAGIADQLVLLSPRVWKTEAAEHNPSDVAYVRDLIAHELTHVYHGQHNPRPNFDGMDDMGWFVEGLAVLASGQLERSQKGRAAEALKAGRAPAKLADAWSGRYRYGVCGSMVEFLDHTKGRDVIKKLLSAVTNEEALRILNTTEQKFLDDWKAHIATPK